MLAYKVTFNGTPAATVGMKEDGLIFVKASWLSIRKPDNDTSPNKGDARFTITGLRNPDEMTNEHLEWFHEELKPGDKITIELVESDVADQPVRIRREPKNKDPR